jgi:hypothetical protein
MRLIYLSLALLLLNSCGNATQPEGKAPEQAALQPPASGLPAGGTEKLMHLLGKYYILKDALVASKEAEAAQAAGELVAAADSFNTFLAMSHTVAADYVAAIDTIRSSAMVIRDAKDSLELQRTAFEPVSDHMFHLLGKAQLRNAGVYRQFCPMAFNDKGARWLSNTDEIRNPYFGKKMLECGEVVDSLK